MPVESEGVEAAGEKPPPVSWVCPGADAEEGREVEEVLGRRSSYGVSRFERRRLCIEG
jgi:hypothetical protein